MWQEILEAHCWLCGAQLKEPLSPAAKEGKLRVSETPPSAEENQRCPQCLQPFDETLWGPCC